MQSEQYVCLVCGFNMVGHYPEKCPFCGASREHFLTAEECSKRFTVHETAVTDGVTCLRSEPALGLEHSAYRVKTGQRHIWIDCPSSFNTDLEPAECITFTHHHFMGASNMYREHFGASVQIHRLDYENNREMVEPFNLGNTFDANFSIDGAIQAYHIGGHTAGFTIYIFNDVLFACDYVFAKADPVKFNPFGPREETLAGGARLRELLDGQEIQTVCGQNYVESYATWLPKLDQLLDA